MKKTILFLLFFVCIYNISFPQTDSKCLYKKTSVMIPMRDGIKLYTSIFSPVNPSKPVPILITRTPYGASFPVPDDSVVNLTARNFNYYYLAKDGYIFVYQDIRGKYKSEGTMQIHQPLNSLNSKRRC